MDERSTIFGRIGAALGGLVLLGLVFTAGVYVGSGHRSPVDTVTTLFNKEPVVAPDVDFSPFWLAWTTINDKFVPVASSTPRKISDQEKVYGAIAGLTKSLGDPYTIFFDPEEEKIFQSEVNNEFEGVGMEIGIKNNIITVVAPLKDTPAFRAGMKAGDKILKIDGVSTENMGTDQAVQKIRGKKGTSVELQVYREGDGEKTVTIVRDTIKLPTIEIKKDASTGKAVLKKGESGTGLRPDGIFIIRLYNFGGSSAEMFQEALQAFVDSGSNKLILDLRGNPGGYLESAVDMASWFLPKDKVVVRENSGGRKPDLTYFSKGYDIFNANLKMIVLIDQGSASASEILAGALSEHGIAKLVGQRSFGKGSVQELVKLTDNTSMKITIARWFTPNGISISDGGLKPDYEVTATKENTAGGKDPQLDKAVSLLLK